MSFSQRRTTSFRKQTRPCCCYAAAWQTNSDFVADSPPKYVLCGTIVSCQWCDSVFVNMNILITQYKRRKCFYDNRSTVERVLISVRQSVVYWLTTSSYLITGHNKTQTPKKSRQGFSASNNSDTTLRIHFLRR